MKKLITRLRMPDVEDVKAMANSVLTDTSDGPAFTIHHPRFPDFPILSTELVQMPSRDVREIFNKKLSRIVLNGTRAGRVLKALGLEGEIGEILNTILGSSSILFHLANTFVEDDETTEDDRGQKK